MFSDDLENYSIKGGSAEIDPEEIILDAEQIKSKDSGVSSLERRLEIPINPKVFILLGFFISVIFLIFFARSLSLQLVSGKKYTALAERNRSRLTIYPAARGIIYDRSGLPLVKNVPSFDAVVDLADFFKDNARSADLINRLTGVFNLPSDELEREARQAAELKNSPKLLLATNLDHEKILAVESQLKDLPALKIEKNAAREYADAPAFSHLLGYMGKISLTDKDKYQDYASTERVGKSGLELTYEKVLRGSPGYEEIEVDALGREKRILGTQQPVNGRGLILSIDAELQSYLYDQLAKFGTKGAAIALDPRDGGVLALVSFPGFDSNIFSKSVSSGDFQKTVNDPDKPLLNRVVNGEYPPGSTIKPLLAIAGLEEGVVTPRTKVNDDDGQIFVGNFRFGDWKVHGVVDIIKAIAESCDIYFYYLGGGYGDQKGLGVEKIEKYLKLFGFGQPTGIDLPSERVGLVPNEQWKLQAKQERWYIGDTYHLSIGQGDLLVTPLQLAVSLAAVANQGTVYQPQLVDKIVDENKTLVKDIQPIIIRQNFVSQENMNVAREGMRQTIVAGTARSLSELPVKAAGKTGTAQFGNSGKTHGWFTVFAPYTDPRIAMVVLVEGGGEGSSTAVPIARETLKWYFNRNNKSR